MKIPQSLIFWAFCDSGGISLRFLTVGWTFLSTIFWCLIEETINWENKRQINWILQWVSCSPLVPESWTQSKWRSYSQLENQFKEHIRWRCSWHSLKILSLLPPRRWLSLAVVSSKVTFSLFNLFSVPNRDNLFNENVHWWKKLMLITM